MILKRWIVLGVITAVVGLANPAEARGRLGVSYIHCQAGWLRPGNKSVREIDNSVFAGGVELNLPFTKCADSVWSLAYSRLDGSNGTTTMDIKAMSLTGGANLYLASDQKITPYVGLHTGYVWSETTANLPGYRHGHYNKGLTLSLGLGTDISISRSTALRPQLSYEWIDDADDFLLGLELTQWFGILPFGTLGVSYGFDQGDVLFSLGLGLQF